EEVAVHGVEAGAEQVGAAPPVDVVAEEEDEVGPRAEGVYALGHRGLGVTAPLGGAPFAVAGIAQEHHRHLARPPRSRAGIGDRAGWRRRLGARDGGRGESAADDCSHAGEERARGPARERAPHILTVMPKEMRRCPAERTEVSRSTTTWLMSMSRRK